MKAGERSHDRSHDEEESGSSGAFASDEELAGPARPGPGLMTYRHNVSPITVYVPVWPAPAEPLDERGTLVSMTRCTRFFAFTFTGGYYGRRTGRGSAA